MYERYTERSRQVIVLAQNEARAMKHSRISTGHIVLGLLREEQGLAARVLDLRGITVEMVRMEVAQIIPLGAEEVGRIPFTPNAQKVVDGGLALRAALTLGHNYIGTEHLLLGLLNAVGSTGERVLRGFEQDTDVLRDGVMQQLRGPSWRTVAFDPSTPRSPYQLEKLSPEELVSYREAQLESAKAYLTRVGQATVELNSREKTE